MKPFAEWTYQDAVKEIAARKDRRVGDAEYKVNRAMVEEHDLWQDGDMWRGPRGTDAAWAAGLQAAIEKQFIPGGAVLEALSNFARGLFGKEANVQAVPARPLAEGSEEEKRANEEATELVEMLSVWWDRVGLWKMLRHAGARSRWAGWGSLRLWIPEGKLEAVQSEEGSPPVRELPTFQSLEEALSAIDLSAPEPDHAIVISHPETQQQAALFHFVDGESPGDREKSRVELWFQDGEETRLRILPQTGDPEELGPYAWGGALPVTEMDGELMITEIVRRQESGLGFAETNVVKTGETAGFRERYTTNAEPNGVWLQTPPSGVPNPRSMRDESNALWYLHTIPRSLGPAVSTDLIGIKMKATGPGEAEVRATPGVVIADPVDPEFAIKGAEYRRKRVLELCGQGHLAMHGTGKASGFAYEQARATFRGDLEWHKSPAERAILLLFQALIRMAESMTAEAPRWLERFRLIVTLSVDPGPVSPEFREQIMTEVEKGLRSRASAMGLLGIEDVGGELEAIEQDPEAQLGLLRKRVEVMTLLMGASPGLSLVQAAVAAGWDEADARKLFAEADAAAVQERQARDEIADALRRGRGEPEPAVA